WYIELMEEIDKLELDELIRGALTKKAMDPLQILNEMLKHLGKKSIWTIDYGSSFNCLDGHVVR
ncbi:11086_t:CDS:2, partial [Gigaspora margarita]